MNEKNQREMKRLDETFKSIMISSLACFLTIMMGNCLHEMGIVPLWSTLLVDYILPWIFALTNIILLIRIVKITMNIEILK
ncbi:hypothetical protein ACTFR8_28565 [Bacillus cereus group sp. MYBK15-3]|uniref:hypothetical protein n=1 Tax=Bacillus cereus group TaxID=86661 RepID=UPI00240671B7|nr:hypothetical protein [Bacillus cereus]MDF9524845.1 hypothetical protein [Bacillus cereus]MDF9564524.1 hypothetical protein [Bacillus cereus]